MVSQQSEERKYRSNNMVYILCGIDKSGKSTVIQDLKDLLPGAVVFKIKNKPKDGSPDERAKVQYIYDELFHQALQNSQDVPVIFDRAYPSELVYSKINRGYDAFYVVDWWRLDESLKDAARLIYCSAPDDVLVQRFNETGDKDLTSNQFKEVLERYEMFLEKTSLPVLRLDTTKSREENKELMKQFIEQ